MGLPLNPQVPRPASMTGAPLTRQGNLVMVRRGDEGRAGAKVEIMKCRGDLNLVIMKKGFLVILMMSCSPASVGPTGFKWRKRGHFISLGASLLALFLSFLPPPAFTLQLHYSTMSSLGRFQRATAYVTAANPRSATAPSSAPQLSAFAYSSAKAAPLRSPLAHKQLHTINSNPTSARATPSPLGSDSEDSDESAPNSPQPDDDSLQSTDKDEQEEQEQEEAAAEITSLPTRSIFKPKGIAEREREKRAGGSNKSMAASLGRKRADSLKWSKYAKMGAVTIELDLSNDELSRRT